jgi:hypothetical protein
MDTTENIDAPRKNGRNPRLNNARLDNDVGCFSIIGQNIYSIVYGKLRAGLYRTIT